MRNLTLTITGSAEKGYEISCQRRDSAGKDEEKNDRIPAGESPDSKHVADVLGEQPVSVKKINAIGEAMANTFLGGKAGALFFEEREEFTALYDDWLDGGKKGAEPILRTYLQVVPPELRILPWECMRRDFANLFFDRKFPLIRLAGKKFAKAAAIVEWPVRILAVVGGGAPDVKAIEEVRALRWILRPHDHSFDIDVFDANVARALPPVDELKQRMRDFKPHIIHFAGHAHFGKEPSLEIARNVIWTPEDIRTFFQSQTWKPRLIFLNACRTGLPAETGDSFGTALAACTLSLISMNADVQGEEAGDCAGKIYRELSDGEPLDRAVCTARAELGSQKVAGYHPVLTAMADPDQLVFTKPCCVGEDAELVERLTRKDEIKYFLDRTGPRRELFESIKSGRKAIAVVGDSYNGKTWFLMACSRCLTWRGYPVIYIDLRKRNSWNELLRGILSGGEFLLKLTIDGVAQCTVEKLIGPPESPKEFAQDLPGAVEATLNAIRPSGGKAGEASSLPLILMLDHIRLPSQSEPALATDAASFLNYFFAPIREGDGRIRVVMSFEDASILKGPAADAAGWRQVDLLPFPSEEIQELTRDWVRARNPAGLAVAEKLIADLPESRSPKELSMLWDLLRRGKF